MADPACRLLTILGPGGMGKTRLAIQAARADRFPAGRLFRGPGAGHPRMLAAAIVQALPAPSRSGWQPTCCATLRDKQLLLILDNFEHLAEGGANCW